MRLLAMSLLLAGCGSALSEPEDGLLVRTTAAVYAPWDTIAVRISNGTGEAVYVAHCNHRISLEVERRVNGGWTHQSQVNGPLCQAIYESGEIPIAGGSSVVAAVRLGETGRFRFKVYGRRPSEDFGSLVVTSPPFDVRYPPD